MIVSVGVARQTRCPEDIGKGNGNCQALDCMAWEFYIPPPGITMEKKPKHGIKDRDKKGYCGKVHRR